MLVLADPDRFLIDRLAGKLPSHDSVGQVEDVHALRRLIEERSSEVEVVILGPGLPVGPALETAQRIQSVAPQVSFILVARDLTSELLHSALRAGVRDVLPASFAYEQMREAVQRAEALSRQLRGRPPELVPELPRGEPGRVLTVFSSKGGCGKSFVATNLGVLLAAQTGKKVALVDLDLQSGDLAIMLQLLPAYTIHDAAESIDRIDAEALSGYLTPHRSGVLLLAGPSDPSLAESVSGKAVHRIIDLLRHTFPYVVVDGPAFFTDQVIAALDESDECVLMASMDVPSIKNLKLALQTLEQLNFTRNRLRLVLNRADSKVGLRLSEVEKTLGTSIDVAVPSSREVPLSINQGVPLAIEHPKSPVVAALAKLAELVRAPKTNSPAEGARWAFLARR